MSAAWVEVLKRDATITTLTADLAVAQRQRDEALEIVEQQNGLAEHWKQRYWTACDERDAANTALASVRQDYDAILDELVEAHWEYSAANTARELAEAYVAVQRCCQTTPSSMHTSACLAVATREGCAPAQGQSGRGEDAILARMEVPDMLAEIAQLRTALEEIRQLLVFADIGGLGEVVRAANAALDRARQALAGGER